VGFFRHHFFNPEPFHPAPVNLYGWHYCHRRLPFLLSIKVRLSPQAQQVTVTIRQKMLPWRA